MTFYTIKQSDDHSALTYAYEYKAVMGDAESCEFCGACISLLTWQPPFRVELEMIGREFSDIIFDIGNGLLLSERTVHLCRDNRLTGLKEIHPVEVVKVRSRWRKRPEPPRYFYAPIQRGPARVDVAASGIVWLAPPACQHCLGANKMRWQRVQLEPNTWGGEDIFAPIGLSGTMIISPRFKQICQQHELKNVMTLPIEQDSHDFYPGVKDGKEWAQIVAEDNAPPPADDQEALHRLAKVARLDIEQLITHYLHLPTKRAAKRAHIALSARDFEVDEPYKFFAKWGLRVHTRLIPEESAIIELRQMFTEIAEENDGTYDRWEADLRTEEQRAHDRQRGGW